MKNPINNGFYADPEARFYEGEYWVYVTRSDEYEKQLNLDAFHSKDLESWEKKESIIKMSDFPWVKKAVWAPTIIEKNSKYYLVFATNDIHHDNEGGGLEIAVSDTPGGEFKGFLGKTLIGKFVNRAQPIDAHLFKDDDGTVYLYYGGWRHCNVVVMNNEMNGFVPIGDGELFHEITPAGYVEGPCMLKKDGLYYFMWSEGDWQKDTYCVCYGVAESPLGPFSKKGVILRTQEEIATGPGHHGYLQISENKWKIVYHRHPVGASDGNERVVCVDDLIIGNGEIEPVDMT